MLAAAHCCGTDKCRHELPSHCWLQQSSRDSIFLAGPVSGTVHHSSAMGEGKEGKMRADGTLVRSLGWREDFSPGSSQQ